MKTKRNSYLWRIVVFTIAMIALCVLTKDIINNIRFNGVHCYLKEYWLSDILSTIRAAFREEIVWRLVPLLFFSSIILLLKVVNAKRSIVVLLHVVACITLIIIQFDFAFAHMDEYLSPNISYIDLAIIQAPAGVYFCAAYCFALHLIIKKRIQLVDSPITVRMFFSTWGIANAIGLACAIVTHLISNIIIIFLHTYYVHRY